MECVFHIRHRPIEGLTIKGLKEQKKKGGDFIEYGNAEDAEVKFVEDCFEDLERPKFGWRVRVTLSEKEPCDATFENPDQSPCNLNSNSDVEADLNHYAQSRQTTEESRSSAAPDCRIEFVCDKIPDAAQSTPNRRGVGIIQEQIAPDQLG